jgi:hypothetical protein
MFSSLLVLLLMLVPAGASTPRKAFYSCFGDFVSASTEKKLSQQDFDSQLAGACTSERQAFRNSVVASDVARGISRKTSEQGVSDEIADYINEVKDRFRDEMAATTPKVAGAAPATPAATPASAAAPN